MAGDHIATTAVWLSFAGIVVDDMNAYKRRLTFSRPAVLPNDDLTLFDALRAARVKRPRASQEDRDIAEAFYGWRNAIVAAEFIDAGNVDALLRLAFHAEQTPEGNVILSTIVGWLRENYNLNVVRPIDETQIPRIAARAARDESTVPTWLLNGDRPPRYTTTRSDAGEEVVVDTDAFVPGFANLEFSDL